MMKKPVLLLCAAVLAITTSVTRAQEDHAYTQGPVTLVSFVRTEPGMFEEYMRYLDNTYKKLMDQLKKKGAVTDYAVYQALPRDAQDADVIILIYRKGPPDTPGGNIIEIEVAKHRNGPTGHFKLTFLKEFTRFENYAAE